MGASEDVRKNTLYAIEVHSFSKGTVPTTLDAKVQRASYRLDAIGDIGIAWVFTFGGSLAGKLYNSEDLFSRARELNDDRWDLYHFFGKLLNLEPGMHTKAAKMLAKRRVAVLGRYILNLEKEIGVGVS